MNFSTLIGLSIPEGAATKIEWDGIVLWQAFLDPVYDDEWPVVWNSKAVVKAGNAKSNDLVKISNLMPTLAEMETLVFTYGDKMYSFYDSSTVTSDSDSFTAAYGDENDSLLVFVVKKTEGTVHSETGMYVRDVYTLDGETVDCMLAVAATGIYDVEQQGTVLYIKSAPATLSGNTLEVT